MIMKMWFMPYSHPIYLERAAAKASRPRILSSYMMKVGFWFTSRSKILYTLFLSAQDLMALPLSPNCLSVGIRQCRLLSNFSFWKDFLKRWKLLDSNVANQTMTHSRRSLTIVSLFATGTAATQAQVRNLTQPLVSEEDPLIKQLGKTKIGVSVWSRAPTLNEILWILKTTSFVSFYLQHFAFCIIHILYFVYLKKNIFMWNLVFFFFFLVQMSQTSFTHSLKSCWYVFQFGNFNL